MAKGTRYTPEFKAKVVRLLAESRSSYSSETNAISAVAKDLGIAPESLRRCPQSHESMTMISVIQVGIYMAAMRYDIRRTQGCPKCVESRLRMFGYVFGEDIPTTHETINQLFM